MKSLQFAAAAAVIGIMGLWQPVNAQTSDQSGSRGSNQTESSSNMPKEDSGPQGMPTGMMEHRGMMQHRGMMARGGMMDRGGMMARGGSHNTGARFHVSIGNASIDIRCPAKQAVERCVRAAGDLIDKITSIKQSGAAGNPSPGQKPPSAQ